MSALDKLKQEQQQTSDTSQALTLRLDAIEQQTRELTKAVNAVSGFLRAMDEAQSAELKRVRTSISQQHEQSSQTQLDDETKNRLSEIEKTLSAVAKQLSASGLVKLSDGSEVKQSDLDSYSMMKQISEQMTTLTSTSEKLAEEVHAKSRVLDDEKAKRWLKSVGDWIAKKVDDHFDQAVQEPVNGLRSDLQGFREEMGTLGTERLSEVRRDVATLMGELNDAHREIKAIERRVTFVGISRLALAVLPLFASLLLVGGLVWGVGSMVGIGPLFGWAWGAFTAASLWWQKALIAAATLGGAALFIWVVLRVSRWVYEELR